MGRAADYFLQGYENVVRIFIYAPEEYRVKRIMEIYGDSKNYNLCIDSSIGVEKCAEIIANYIKAVT